MSPLLRTFDSALRLIRPKPEDLEEFAEYQLRQQKEHWAHQNQDDEEQDDGS